MIKDTSRIQLYSLCELALDLSRVDSQSIQIIFTIKNFAAYRNQHFQRGTVMPVKNVTRGACTGMCLNWLNNTLTCGEEQIKLSAPDPIVANVIQRHLAGNVSTSIDNFPGLKMNPFDSIYQEKLNLVDKKAQRKFFRERILQLKSINFNCRFIRKWRILKQLKQTMLENSFFPLAKYLLDSEPKRLFLYNGSHVNAVWITQKFIYYFEPNVALFGVLKNSPRDYALEFVMACVYHFYKNCQQSVNYDCDWAIYTQSV